MFLSVLAIGLVLTSCKKKDAATTVEAPSNTESAALSGGSGKYAVNEGSLVSWEGSKPTGSHTGFIKVSDGSLAVENGKVTGGKFTMSIGSLTVTDLKAGDGKEDLEGHLKSDDFFGAAANPEASFEITKTTGLTNDADGANHLIYGNLTLKGVTKPVSFKATVSTDGDNVNVSTQQFEIDRTKWDMKYGSGTFFDDLKDKVINDNVGIQIELSASKA